MLGCLLRAGWLACDVPEAVSESVGVVGVPMLMIVWPVLGETLTLHVQLLRSHLAMQTMMVPQSCLFLAVFAVVLGLCFVVW